MRMAMRKTMNRTAAALIASALLSASSSGAQESLAGKNVTLIIGFGAGGGYDLWVRNWLAVYAELTEVILKGSSANAGASTIDERSTFVIAGIRVRLGK